MNTKNSIITLIVALLVGGASFYGGMMYQKSQGVNRMVSFSGQGGQRMMQFGQGQGAQAGGRAMSAQGMRPVSGEILSLDDTSATVKLPDGSSKIVIFSDKTTVSKTSETTKTDLKTGETITAFGTQNADGSVTAQNISVGNMMFRTFQRVEQGSQPSGTPSSNY